MKIILIGNYPPDKQESMNRFAAMLINGFTKEGIETEIWLPIVFAGKFSKSTIAGIGKWLGYFDKWILFPLVLRIRLLKKKYNNHTTSFHICDHSNAIYLGCLPKYKTAITCHDVLAMRGAFGFKDAYCEASRFGVILQKWIFGCLRKAKKIATVSSLTLKQLTELNNGIIPSDATWVVVHNAFNENFKAITAEEARLKISKLGLKNDLSFIFHVGSALKRKNRILLIDMLLALENNWTGVVCFAGEPIDAELNAYIQNLGLQERVVSIVKPDHENLLALYTTCEAFIFPSFSEGFGWPVIEAQACGAPVIASNIEPMPEVSGGAALLESPYNAADFAKAFLTLKDSDLRSSLISNGFENCKRFSLDKMIESYSGLHNMVIKK